jgi:phosphopantetheinyl transferase (holo-ACP synthase)
VEIASSPNRQVHVVLHGATKEMTNEAHIADVKLSTAQCRSYATGYAIALADRLPR